MEFGDKFAAAVSGERRNRKLLVGSVATLEFLVSSLCLLQLYWSCGSHTKKAYTMI